MTACRKVPSTWAWSISLVSSVVIKKKLWV